MAAVKIRLHRARARLKKELGSGCDFYRDGRNECACQPKPKGVSPQPCSGLPAARHDVETLHVVFGAEFELLDRREERPPTAGVSQPFTYCLCRDSHSVAYGRGCSRATVAQVRSPVSSRWPSCGSNCDRAFSNSSESTRACGVLRLVLLLLANQA